MAGLSGAHVEAARRVLALAGMAVTEATGAQASGAPAGHVYDALMKALAPVIGAAGARAIFVRSVKLTEADFPALRELREIVDAANAPESSANLAPHLVGYLNKLDSATASQVATGLYAALFALLAKFIGEQLVWQIVKKAFPALDTTGPTGREEAK